MKVISNNNIVRIHKGDTFQLPVLINKCTTAEEDIYLLQDEDQVFLSVCEPNQEFQKGIIRKIASKTNQNDDGVVIFKFNESDTINLLPGTYYYEVKLVCMNALDENLSENITYDITTIVAKRKFIIMD